MMICLHGFLGRGADWQGFQWPGVIMIPTDWMESEYAPTLSEVGAQINRMTERAVQDRFGTEASSVRKILLGYSLGGRVGLHALLEQPDFWDGAILISTHLGLQSAAERMARVTADEAWAQRLENESWPNFFKAWNAQPVFGARDSASLREAAPYPTPLLAQALRSWSLGKQSDLRLRLVEFKRPLLWLTGQEDEKFSLLARNAATLSASGIHRALPQAAHRAPWENRDAFYSAVDHYLRSNSFIHPEAAPRSLSTGESTP